MSTELKQAYLHHLEEQLLDHTRVGEDTSCPACHRAMTLTFKTPRTTTFRCEACGRRLSRQTLR